MLNRFFLLSCFLLLFFACKKNNASNVAVKPSPFFIKAADMSFLPQVRQSGVKVYNQNGYNEDMLQTLVKSGVNTIRLRLWKDPVDGHCGFEEVKTLAAELKKVGLKVWLTVHYSDTWADPGAQTKPLAWKNISYAQLKDSVFDYTGKIMAEIQPDYIQIGNEINNGFLWPEGNISSLSQFKELMNQGIMAVRLSSYSCSVILQYAGYKDVLWFMNQIGEVGADIIGLSYYPTWHGTNLDSLQLQLSTVSTLTNKPVIIAETSYPFTLAWNDWTNNIIGDSSQLHPQFPATKNGQRDFLLRIRDIASKANNGQGFCYWGGEWISFKGETAKDGSSNENQAFWDFNGSALPILDAYK